MTAVLVIGMHRSGTSLVAGALKLAGAYLGPERDLMQPSPENAKGYWEHLGFVELNENLLSLLGGSWFQPPLLTANALKNDEITSLQTEARKLIESEFKQHALWVCKDPRATVLLPFWRTVLDDPRYVLCVRNPLDVAYSLEKRDGIPVEYGAALWHTYTLHGLLDTSPSERVVIFYEEILRDPLAALSPVFAHLGAADRLTEPNVQQSLAGFADTNLEHHRHTLDDLLAHPSVLAQTKQLYEALLTRDDHAVEKAVVESEAQMEKLYTITGAYGHAHKAYIELAQVRHELNVTRAMLQHSRDILNSRTHRAAAAANDWLIRIRKSR